MSPPEPWFLILACPCPSTHLGLEILLQQGLHLCILLLQRVILHQQLGPLGQHEARGGIYEAR